MIRQAISPRWAMRSDWIMAKHPESSASLFPGGSPREARPKGRGESPASHSEHAEVRALRYGRVQRRRKGQPEHIASLHGVNHPIVPQARRCVPGAAFVQIGRAQVGTPVTNAQLVFRLMLENKKKNY